MRHAWSPAVTVPTASWSGYWPGKIAASAPSRFSKSTCAIRLVAAIAQAGAAAADLSFLLLEQAQILDGELPEDPTAFADRLNRLVMEGLSKA